jgi:molybdate transport system substrate-binding protein
MVQSPVARSALFIALVAAVAAVAPASAQALNVYAASSLRDAFPAIDGSPSYNFGGSDTLQAQIEHGAPADVFASASPNEARALFREGLCSRPVTFATNRLVIIVPKANPGHLRSVYSLRSGGRRVAIGAAGVPVGDYTRQVLRRLHLSSILRSNTVSQETNVAGITSKVALGSADAGFVYVTDGRSARGRVSMITVPPWAQPPVRYSICTVRRSGVDAGGAGRFIAKVRSTAGRRALKRFGFGLPPRA